MSNTTTRTTTILNKLYSLTMVWNEFGNDENIEFKSFKDLDTYIKEHYVTVDNIRNDGTYDKVKLKILVTNEIGMIIPLFIGGLSRVDVGLANGDFNPFNENLRDYIVNIYSGRSILNYDGIEIPFDFSNLE